MINQDFNTQKELVDFVADLLGQYGSTEIAQAIVKREGWSWSETTDEDIRETDVVALAAELGF
jgi:hypothetical protein